jgi:hypothetical protein
MDARFVCFAGWAAPTGECNYYTRRAFIDAILPPVLLQLTALPHGKQPNAINFVILLCIR